MRLRTTIFGLTIALLGALGLGPLPGCGDNSGTNAPPDLGSADLTPSLDMAQPNLFTLPGNQFFPESINASPDGTIFVSSIATGQVVKIEPGSTTPVTFIAGNGVNPGDPKGVTGLLPDAASSTLYLCAVDLSMMPPPTELRAYDLATAQLKQIYSFSTGAFCNDLALDAAGNLFVTDSFGKIWRLAHGSTTPAIWSTDPLLAPPMGGGFGANGIALDGAGNLYVGNTFQSMLLRIAIKPDGNPGALTPINLSAPISFPDGMRLVDANTLVLVEAMGNQITKVALSGNNGTVTPISGTENQPSSLVKIGSNWWVTEGQILTLFKIVMGSPTLPFDVKRVPVM